MPDLNVKLRSVFSLRCHRQGWSEDVLKVRLAQLLSWKIVTIRLQKNPIINKIQKKLAPDWPSPSTEKHNPVGWDALAYLDHRSCCLFPFVPKLTVRKQKKKDFCLQSIVLREKKYSTVLLSHSSGFYLLGVNGYESKHPGWFLLERPVCTTVHQEPGQDTPVTRWTETILKRKIRLRRSAVVCRKRFYSTFLQRSSVSVLRAYMYLHYLEFVAEVLLFVLKSILAQDRPPFAALRV